MAVIANDGYMMLLDALYIGDKKFGNISENGIDWGGDDPEFINLFAAQVRSAPVKKVERRAATNVLTFRLIELVPENCKDTMGGEVDGTKWIAPTNTVLLEESAKILTGTGQTIEIARATLNGAVRGNLGGTEALGIDCTMEILSAPDGGSPFNIDVTTPFISASPLSLNFPNAAGSQVVNIGASGPFAVSGAVPAGFSVEVVGGKVTIQAAKNTGAARTGSITFALVSDTSQKVVISVSQVAGT